MRQHETAMQESIAAALDCVRACEKCATACLREKNIDPLRECIRLNLDCAEVCDLTAKFMVRQSRFHDPLGKLCADICEACAAECERHDKLEHCRQCAQACRKCVEACRSMVEAMA